MLKGPERRREAVGSWGCQALFVRARRVQEAGTERRKVPGVDNESSLE